MDSLLHIDGKTVDWIFHESLLDNEVIISCISLIFYSKGDLVVFYRDGYMISSYFSISISSSIKSLITMVYCICQAANDRHYKQNIKKTTQTVTILYI